MSGDLISRKMLMKHIEIMSRRWGEDYDVNQVLGDIEDFPVIETDSVVQCKGCRKYDTETQCCKFWPDEGYRHPDHLCAEGERRDDRETD